jgi:cbb3-type cytochrome c oxidase subunit III
MKLSNRISILAVMAAALLLGAVAHRAEEKTEGSEIYKGKCTMCHGVDGKGFSALKTPDFTDPKWQASVKDSEILNVIKNGKKDTAMPAFADKLSQKEILAVVREVRAFGKKK